MTLTDEPSYEALDRLLADRDRRRAGLFTPQERATQKVVELLLSGCPVRVDAHFPPGHVTAIDDSDSFASLRGDLPEPLRSAVAPTRMVGFHSEAERDAFMAALRKAYSCP